MPLKQKRITEKSALAMCKTIMTDAAETSPANPLISIVTVSFNNLDGLNRTIRSVADQTFRDYELIVVDGGSTDGTRELLDRLRPLVHQAVSEPDKGIYDAMNKGVRMARGEWIIFMNAGDLFADDTVLAASSSVLREGNAGIVYGDSILRYADGAERYRPAATQSRLPYGMICSHQAIFSRRKLNIAHPFTVAPVLSAPACDFDFLVTVYKAGEQFCKLDQAIARVEAGGISDLKRQAVLRHYVRVLKRHDLLNAQLGLFYAYHQARTVMVKLARACLPIRVLYAGRQLRYGKSIQH
ncbi:glycosyltransferase family 2 protein [Indioceanicola profundi]|uniref:glycosyltransferase family 2 protein n=1 Tax=Indioceanicola profundi TaxID=2220096 RepID=UPI000E6A9B83|nr:glycosyltransferase family 2 protein [Indioceanicola profundi]